MTDSVGESRHVGPSVYRFNSRFQELTNSFLTQLITHMKLNVRHFKYHIFKSICTFVISFQDILIPYNHFRFIWYTTKALEIRIEVSEQTEVVGFRFLPFDLGPRLGDHSSLVNKNYATLSG